MRTLLCVATLGAACLSPMVAIAEEADFDPATIDLAKLIECRTYQPAQYNALAFWIAGDDNRRQQYCPSGQGGSGCPAVLRWRAGARDGAEIKEASLRWLEAGYRGKGEIRVAWDGRKERQSCGRG